nr:hypothetical protein [uncultured bacterium]
MNDESQVIILLCHPELAMSRAYRGAMSRVYRGVSGSIHKKIFILLSRFRTKSGMTQKKNSQLDTRLFKYNLESLFEVLVFVVVF